MKPLNLRIKVLAPAALAVVFILLAGFGFHHLEIETYRQETRLDVLQRAGALRARLEGLINSNLMLTQGLEADISLNGDIDRKRFYRFTRHLLAKPNQIRNVGLAPNLVISEVYPLEGNESAVGLDYRRNESQRAAALLASETGKTILAGPLELVQGGNALIGRIPVFIDMLGLRLADQGFWGLISVVIDTDRLFHRAGLLEDQPSMKISLRGSDGLGWSGPIFLGEDSVFKSNPVLLDVVLPHGKWIMAAAPIGGWPSTSPNSRFIWGVTFMIAMLFAVLFIARAKLIGAQTAQLETEKRLNNAVESLQEGFALWDQDDRMVMCNSRFRRFFPGAADLLRPGVDYETMLRASVAAGDTVVNGSDEAWIQGRLTSRLASSSSNEQRLSSGEWIYITETRSDEGGIVGVCMDMTQLRQAQEAVYFRAHFDTLTGLLNRTSFFESLETEVSRTTRNRSTGAVLFIDLDRFKNINDSFGHACGDDLLVQAAARIETCIRRSDTLARLSVDEFAAILADVDNEYHAAAIAEKILQALSEAFTIAQNVVHSSASIGISIFPRDSMAAQTLLHNADLAMFQAKKSGRRTYRFFTETMNERATQYAAIQQDLRRALDEDELTVHFQPIVDASGEQILGFESLARWYPPGKDAVRPDHFIPIAEDAGLIGEIGERIFDLACREMRLFDQRGASDGPFLAVNISTRQFQSGFGAAAVSSILKSTRFPAKRLVLEITESVLMQDDTKIHENLSELRRLGVRLSIDDFGTGYSSLGYLKQFPVDFLKIDKSFIGDLDHDPNSRTIVRTIIAMAKSLNLSVVCEGVENSSQLQHLAGLGEVMLQGFYFARPKPMSEITAGGPRSRRQVTSERPGEG